MLKLKSRRCWAPNGLELMEWPLGLGYVPSKEDDVMFAERMTVLRANSVKGREAFLKKWKELKELERTVLVSEEVKDETL